MSEFSELTLEVNLVDNASAQLEVLKKSFAEIGVGTQNLENLRRHTSELEKSMKSLVEAITKGPDALLKFATGFGAVSVAIGGAVMGIEKLTRSLTEMSQEAVNLNVLAHRIGMQPAETRAMIEFYERFGKGRETARREAEGFAAAMTDVQRGAAGVATELQKLGMEGVSRNLDSFIASLRRMPDLPTQWEAVREFARIEGEREARRIGRPATAGQLEAQILEKFGIPSAATITGSMRGAIAEVDEMRRQSEARALAAGQKQLEMVGRIHEKWSEIVRHMSFNVMAGPLGQGLQAIDAILEKWLKAEKAGKPPQENLFLPGAPGAFPSKLPGGWHEFLFGPGVAKNIQEQQRQVPPPLGQERGPTVPGMQGMPQPLMSTGGVAGFTGPYAPMRNWKAAADWAEQLHGDYSTNIERRDLQEQENQKTRALVNELKRANALLSGEETPKAGSPLGLLSTQFGGLRTGLGGGIGAGYGGMGGAGPPGGGSYGAGGTTQQGTPSVPAGAIPPSMSGAASPGYPTGGGFTPVPSLTTPSGAAQPAAGALGGPRNERAGALYQKLLTEFRANPPQGVPPDAARFGITNGTPEEWARFGVSVAHAESGFNPRSTNLSDPGGSFGVFQYSHSQVPGGNAYDVDASVKAFVRDAAASAVDRGGLRGGILGQRFSTIGKNPAVGARYLADPRNWAAAPEATTARPSAVTNVPTQITTPQLGPEMLAGPTQLPQLARPTVGGGDNQIRDISQRMGLRVGGQMRPEGLMIHHTSGRERGAEGVADVLRQRGLSVQYVIDREGNITQLTPEGRTAFHAGQLEKSERVAGRRFGNVNLEGVEVIAKSEKDVLPVQREAIARLTALRSQRWGWDPKTSVWGHGELTGRKEAEEGATARMIREGRLALPDVSGPGQTQVAGPGAPTDGARGPTITTPRLRPSTELETQQMAQPAVDRSVIDAIAGQRMRHRAIGTANIDVNVKSEGQKSVTQTGPFRKVRLSRVTAMTHSDSGPPASSGATGESHDPSLDS